MAATGILEAGMLAYIGASGAAVEAPGCPTTARKRDHAKTVLVIAHRGASGHAPENTLAAFKRAIALGATFIETDLQLSRDSRFVAIHDDAVSRTTNGQGKVHDLSLADLRRLDAGSWFGSEFTGERIPTLEEILEFSK